MRHMVTMVQQEASVAHLVLAFEALEPVPVQRELEHMVLVDTPPAGTVVECREWVPVPGKAAADILLTNLQNLMADEGSLRGLTLEVIHSSFSSRVKHQVYQLQPI